MTRGRSDGLATSVDWIVGRGQPGDDLYFTLGDYAYLCHVAVSGMEVLAAYKLSPTQAIDAENDPAPGHEVYDLQTVGMLEFPDQVRVLHELSHQPRSTFAVTSPPGSKSCRKELSRVPLQNLPGVNRKQYADAVNRRQNTPRNRFALHWFH